MCNYRREMRSNAAAAGHVGVVANGYVPSLHPTAVYCQCQHHHHHDPALPAVSMMNASQPLDHPHQPTSSHLYQPPDHPHQPTSSRFYQPPDHPHQPTSSRLYQPPDHPHQPTSTRLYHDTKVISSRLLNQSI